MRPLTRSFAFLWGQGACDRLHAQAGMDLGERRGEVLGEVLGGGDVAAEHDRVVAVGQEILHASRWLS